MNRTALTVAALGIALAISGPALAGTKASDLAASVAKAGAAGKKGLPPGFYTSQAHANGHSAGAPGHDYDHHTKSRGC
ncbi:hypothetical protein [Novosphingobium clariflavum]|uniref:Uncharacterized protein n=1 Tax=Novosphingobium clariflavum TaxID=2029884 RepID=A0ABV6S9I0_9SPHN|nr:hypothetical protein [Novosphingobium clariflavum]